MARSFRLLVSKVILQSFTTRASSYANEGPFELPIFGLVISNGLPANAVASSRELSLLRVLSQSSMLVSIPPTPIFCIHHIRQTAMHIMHLETPRTPVRATQACVRVSYRNCGKYSISHALISEGHNPDGFYWGTRGKRKRCSL